jgi:hypothetical protein
VTYDLVGIPCHFSESEFANVGKLVWAFTVLEHELARSAMWLAHENGVSTETTLDSEIWKIADGTLKPRFKKFLSGMRRICDPEDLLWLEELEKRFPHLDLLRNRICHGEWAPGKNAAIAFRFFDRESLKTERTVDYWQTDFDSISGYTDEVLLIAIMVAAKAKTVP